MKTLPLLAILFLLVTRGAAEAQDDFDSVRCGADVKHALMLQPLPDGPAAAIEKRHTAIGLKDIAGNDISGGLYSMVWMICGQEYAFLLSEDDRVRDALAVPPHSRKSPLYWGPTCAARGKPAKGIIVAILDNPEPAKGTSHYSPDDMKLLVVKTSWKIDEAKAAFVTLEPNGLSCPRNGIVTPDGGP